VHGRLAVSRAACEVLPAGSLNGGCRGTLQLPPPVVCPPGPLELQDAGGGTPGKVAIAMLPDAWRQRTGATAMDAAEVV
jgi:hypothetical protein